MHRTLSRDAAKCSTFVAFLAVKLSSSRVRVQCLVTAELLAYLGGGLSKSNNTENVLLLLNWPTWMSNSFLISSLLFRQQRCLKYVIIENVSVLLLHFKALYTTSAVIALCPTQEEVDLRMFAYFSIAIMI